MQNTALILSVSRYGRLLLPRDIIKNLHVTNGGCADSEPISWSRKHPKVTENVRDAHSFSPTAPPAGLMVQQWGNYYVTLQQLTNINGGGGTGVMTKCLMGELNS